MNLPPGYELRDYTLRGVLGAGGFGITYLASDTLGRLVAIKEYYPRNFCSRIGEGDTVSVLSGDERPYFQSGMKAFLEEARQLALFSGQAQIVDVLSFFEANGTAYMVLDYIEGGTLGDYSEQLGAQDGQWRQILCSLGNALAQLHGSQIYHCDIKPSNIMMREAVALDSPIRLERMGQQGPEYFDYIPSAREQKVRAGKKVLSLTPSERVVLIDFGASKHNTGQHSQYTHALVSPPYSPHELSHTRYESVGPWTDIYMLGMTFYRLLSHIPTKSLPSGEEVNAYYMQQEMKRRGGEPIDGVMLLKPLCTVTQVEDSTLANCIDVALHPDISIRPKMVESWLSALSAEPEDVFDNNVSDVNIKPRRKSEFNAYEDAIMQDTISAYQAHIESYPGGIFAEEARELIVDKKRELIVDREATLQFMLAELKNEHQTESNKPEQQPELETIGKDINEKEWLSRTRAQYIKDIVAKSSSFGSGYLFDQKGKPAFGWFDLCLNGSLAVFILVFSFLVTYYTFDSRQSLPPDGLKSLFLFGVATAIGCLCLYSAIKAAIVKFGNIEPIYKVKERVEQKTDSEIDNLYHSLIGSLTAKEKEDRFTKMYLLISVIYVASHTLLIVLGYLEKGVDSDIKRIFCEYITTSSYC